MENSPFDNLGQQPDWTDEDKAHFERLDYLYHKVFVQNEDGQELVKIWQEHLTFNPADAEGSDLYSLGKNEGVKTFIRNIILTARKVENE